ncbi:MAG TPA: Hsp20/alpha crystallin family protein [Mycobacteriales bacterium]|nr:Hsp20/alpha crystallin family protein [Mycobacteriales bacterium]
MATGSADGRLATSTTQPEEDEMTTEPRREVRRGLPDLFDWAEGLPGMLGWPQINPRGIRVEEGAEDGHYLVRAELPGIDPDRDVSVQVDQGVLAIEAERREERREAGRSEFRYGTFTRRIPLPRGADEAGITARYVGGILEVSVPIRGRRDEARSVPVSRAD